MSADHVPPQIEGGDASPDRPEHVQAGFASWGFVADPTEAHPLPALVVGNDQVELHLELDPELLDELLASLAAQLPDSDIDLDTPAATSDRLPLYRIAGTKAVTLSGWPTANRWLSGTGSSTRIIIGGIIAAVMVLGLLVTF